MNVYLHNLLPLTTASCFATVYSCKRKLMGPWLVPYSLVRAQTVTLILFIWLLARNKMSISKEVSHLY